MCPALRGSTVSYAGDAHFPKHGLEYSLNFWSQPKKKTWGDFKRVQVYSTQKWHSSASILP